MLVALNICASEALDRARHTLEWREGHHHQPISRVRARQALRVNILRWLFIVQLDQPPLTCLAANIAMAFGTPGRDMVSPIQSRGTRPVPIASGSPGLPNRSRCAVSRVVSAVTQAAQALIGLSQRLPSHQSGYRPVMCIANSAEPQYVLPTWLPAISSRSRLVAPSA